MSKQPRHRPQRSFADAKRVIVDCELDKCVHCGQPLESSQTWHMRKYVQTMKAPLFVAGKSKKCANPDCSHSGQHYHASGVLRISLPFSTYGLDVLAFIGWQHEHEHKQFVEIQQKLNERGVLVNERNVGKLYRQFLALLGGRDERVERRLTATAEEHGGLIWGLDGLQPEGHGTLLYVLYEVLSGTPVTALQADHPTAKELVTWLNPYSALPFAALATLSDGEDTLMAALKTCWPDAPHQRCQEHVLGNIAAGALKEDSRLRKQMGEDLGGLAKVPTQCEAEASLPTGGPAEPAPPFCPPLPANEMRP
ncbi:MAG: hypothetical protein KKA73_30475 [Chloroflexi bacterium]|nr:hypothetical protein [Chloroflexota bacterium]